MLNGDTAVTRTLIRVDQTRPSIRLVAPRLGGRYNQQMEFTALISDDVELESAVFALRKGDKAAYEVPGFIQGLYFDTHFWGASLYDLGMGLTFFGDNVKLQMQYGQMTQAMYNAMGGEGVVRYGGNILGLKLLANIYSLPFGSFGGPDWDWLAASLALGANFSLFSETQSGTPTWMSAIVAQLEFPRVTIPKWKWLRTYSLYTEFQLWFVPTDVDAKTLGINTVIPHITGGLRINLF
jgi:hypothetical protein